MTDAGTALNAFTDDIATEHSRMGQARGVVSSAGPTVNGDSIEDSENIVDGARGIERSAYDTVNHQINIWQASSGRRSTTQIIAIPAPWPAKVRCP